MDFPGRGNRSTLKHRGGATLRFRFEVALNHPINGALPLWVRCTENFIEHVEVNAKSLNIVFNGSEAEVDQVNLLTFDQNVVG